MISATVGFEFSSSSSVALIIMPFWQKPQSGRIGTAMATIPWLADAPVDLSGLQAVLEGSPDLSLDRLGI